MDMAVDIQDGDLVVDPNSQLVIRVETLANCSLTGSITLTNTTATPGEYDGIGAVMYVAAVVVICSISIILMIASSVRRNHADRYITVYLRQMELVRKKNYKEAFIIAQTGNNTDSLGRPLRSADDVSTGSKGDRFVWTPSEQTQSTYSVISTIGENNQAETSTERSDNKNEQKELEILGSDIFLNVNYERYFPPGRTLNTALVQNTYHGTDP